MIGYRIAGRPLAAILMTFGLVAASGDATAAEERWGCCLVSILDPFCTVRGDNTIATLTADRTIDTGTINIDNTVVEDTFFKINGSDRFWVWKDEDKAYFLKVSLSRTGRLLSVDIDADGKAGDNYQVEHVFRCKKR